MPGLVPGIHDFAEVQSSKTWMTGTSPAMTKNYFNPAISLASPVSSRMCIPVFARSTT